MLLRALSISLLLFPAACGYRLVSAVQILPGGVRSLGIPTFINTTRQYKLEQGITEAVLQEFFLRTRVPVNSDASGVDAVFQGVIRDMRSSPVSFDKEGFASEFLVTVQISAKLVRVRDGAVLWQNPDFVYQNRYVLNSRVTEFFSEENAALGRLARDFAASLASTVLTR
jgi:outer membrane lipopolysaccharide assembly protein LptE/RlpB